MTDLRRLDWILEKAEAAEGKLTDWERRFIDDLAERRSRMGDRMTISERQSEILERIARSAT